MSGTASLKDFTQAYLIFFMIVRLSGNGTSATDASKYQPRPTPEGGPANYDPCTTHTRLH